MNEHHAATLKMLEIIHKLQESTADSPKIQSEIRKTLDGIREKIMESHAILHERCISDIESDSSMTEEEKQKSRQILNIEKAKFMGLV
jgi:hypothetical protein